MKAVTALEMAGLDHRSIEEYGYPGIVLMENAGIRMFERFLADHPAIRKIDSLVFVAGGGNNGGDALVMARQAFLRGFRNTRVVLGARHYSGTPEIHRQICENLRVPIFSWPSGGVGAVQAREVLKAAGFIFDGLTGTGLKGSLTGEAAELVTFLNTLDGERIALDIPSGIGDSFEEGFTAVKAHTTLTVGLPKLSLYGGPARSLCGDIKVIDIGFPPDLLEGPKFMGELISFQDLTRFLAPLPPEAHKYTRGSLCIFAGSPGTLGAAFLAAETAVRSRAGLVTLMLEEDLYRASAGRFMSVMGRPWNSAGQPEALDLSRYSALCIGPGWGFERRQGWLERCISSGLPGVLDADGLTLLSKMRKVPDFGGRWILTPHPGELARLPGMEKPTISRTPWVAAREVAERYNAVVVLKGHVTCIAEPDGHFFLIDGMQSALGTGGSGDVLAGLTSGLLAGGLSARQAAASGVLVHSRAGRVCFNEKGWFASEDLIPVIPRVLAEAEVSAHA